MAAAAESGPQGYPGLNPKVAAGEIVGVEADHPDTDVDWGEAVGIVEAPIDQVMAIVSDYARYDEFMPHFQKSKVLSQRGNKALIYVEAKVAKGTLTVWSAASKHSRAAARAVSAACSSLARKLRIWKI